MANGTAADITPDSKLGDLLDRWPALEQVLVDLSPHFRALKNPLLRRTVAKVATLRQVSKASGVPLAGLIDRLRDGAGLAPRSFASDPAGAAAERPAWATPEAESATYDARSAILAGEHPLPKVMASLSALQDAEVYELVTPFVPAPLVDLARSKGFLAASVTDDDGTVRTYFRRPERTATP
jgi:hypothetical protein